MDPFANIGPTIVTLHPSRCEGECDHKSSEESIKATLVKSPPMWRQPLCDSELRHVSSHQGCVPIVFRADMQEAVVVSTVAFRRRLASSSCLDSTMLGPVSTKVGPMTRCFGPVVARLGPDSTFFGPPSTRYGSVSSIGSTKCGPLRPHLEWLQPDMRRLHSARPHWQLGAVWEASTEFGPTGFPTRTVHEDHLEKGRFAWPLRIQ